MEFPSPFLLGLHKSGRMGFVWFASSFRCFCFAALSTERQEAIQPVGWVGRERQIVAISSRRRLLAWFEERKKGCQLCGHGPADGVKVFLGVLDYLPGQMLEIHSFEAQFGKPSVERDPSENTDMAHIHADAC